MTKPAIECRCCAQATPKTGQRKCPECRHVFQGNGWDGIDAHWRSKHQSVSTYDEFWAGLCEEHRRGK